MGQILQKKKRKEEDPIMKGEIPRTANKLKFSGCADAVASSLSPQG